MEGGLSDRALSVLRDVLRLNFGEMPDPAVVAIRVSLIEIAAGTGARGRKSRNRKRRSPLARLGTTQPARTPLRRTRQRWLPMLLAFQRLLQPQGSLTHCGYATLRQREAFLPISCRLRGADVFGVPGPPIRPIAPMSSVERS